MYLKTVFTLFTTLALFVGFNAYHELKPTPVNGNTIARFPAGPKIKGVLTKKYYTNFSEAAKNAISEVKDGDSLWLFVQLDKPIKDYVITLRDNNNDGSVSKKMIMGLGIGKVNSDLNGTYHNSLICFQGCKPREGHFVPMDPNLLEQKEFSICLTTYKPFQSAPIFLKTVGGGAAGIWENEITLWLGQANKYAPAMPDWNDQPAFRLKLNCNVDDGIVQYKKMLKQYDNILDKGDVATNTLPSKGTFKDQNILNLVTQKAKQNGWAVKQTYFMDNNWTEMGETTDLDRYRRIYVAVTYKKGNSCFFAGYEAKQNYSFSKGTYGPTQILTLYEDRPIDCQKY